jgi:hypothetical protein
MMTFLAYKNRGSRRSHKWLSRANEGTLGYTNDKVAERKDDNDDGIYGAGRYTG